MKSPIRWAAILAGATLLSAPPLFAEIITRPNTIKYKDTSIPNATGRAGSATIGARALLGRDGNTSIDLVSNGSIEKVQLKAGGAAANFRGASHIAVDGLVQHQVIQLESLVRGVDGARTDVVSASETVKLRPDLAVTAISAPERAGANIDVTIYATVHELNGDAGARANAVLLVDGQVVDRANGIWVDAGGNVAIAFRHAFSAYGNANLEVVVSAVDPGDWDDANNSATKPIEIAEKLDNWAIHAVERISTSQSDSQSPLWDTHTLIGQKDQATDLWAWIQHPVNLSNISLSTSASTDNRTLYDVEDAPFYEPFRRTNNGSLCTSPETWNPRIDVCYQPMSSSHAPNGFMLFEVHWHASDVVYHSWGYDNSIDPDDPFVTEPRGVYDTSDVRVETEAPLGNTVQWDFRFTDGDGNVWHDQPFLASLPQSESHRDDPTHCGYSRRWGFTVCANYKEDRITREGWLSQ